MQEEAVMQAAAGPQPQSTCPDQIDIRSDLDLQTRVSNYLEGQRHFTLRNLDVFAFNGTVTITGVVERFYEKQLAIHCCQRVAGVLQLIDQVEVACVTMSM